MTSLSFQKTFVCTQCARKRELFDKSEEIPTCLVCKVPMRELVYKPGRGSTDDNKEASAKPYKCSVCAKRFRSPAAMKIHQEDHEKQGGA